MVLFTLRSHQPEILRSHQPEILRSPQPEILKSPQPEILKSHPLAILKSHLKNPSVIGPINATNLSVVLFYSDGATRLVFSKKRGKSNKSMRASVILPLGVAVGSPVTLHIGAKRNLMLNVTACNEKLCEAQIKEQYAMKLAEQLAGEPSLEVATSTGGVIAIESISLSGYVGQMYKM